MPRLTGRQSTLHYPIGYNAKAGAMPLEPTTPLLRDTIIEGPLAFNLSSAANSKERHYSTLSGGPRGVARAYRLVRIMVCHSSVRRRLFPA